MKSLNLYILISFLLTANMAYCNNQAQSVRLLNKLEAKLYKGKVFYRDPVLKRLQRLEIALFGEFQAKESPIQKRIEKIENEVYAREINNLEPRIPRQTHSETNLYQLRNNQLRENRNFERAMEEDRRVFSIVNPILQNLMRSSINAVF